MHLARSQGQDHSFPGRQRTMSTRHGSFPSASLIVRKIAPYTPMCIEKETLVNIMQHRRFVTKKTDHDSSLCMNVNLSKLTPSLPVRRGMV